MHSLGGEARRSAVNRRIIALAALLAASIPAITSPVDAGMVWKDNPVWEVDGSLVDLGFGFRQNCLTGPIAVEIAYPAGSKIRLIDDSQGPTQGYVWTTTPRDDLAATKNHVEIMATATFPGKCGSDVAVGIAPISDRFQADRAEGGYNETLAVES